MNGDKQYLSKEKHKELEEELELLRTTKRREVAEKLEYKRSLGDIKENAEYHEAREEQARREDSIATLKNILKTAEIVKSHHAESVEGGATLHIKRYKYGEKMKFEIVGSSEADIEAGKISNESPLGHALIEHKKGEVVEFEAPKGKVKYKIKKVS